MTPLPDLIHTNVADAGSINDKLIAYFSGIYRGSGSPEGVINAPLGATYQDVTTPAIYLKTTATGTLTGWLAFANATGGTAVPPVNGKVGAVGTTAFGTGVTGDVQTNRFTIGGDGKLSWGDGAAVLDTFLSRNAAGVLRTEGAFGAVGVTIGGISLAVRTDIGAAGPGGVSGISFQNGETSWSRVSAGRMHLSKINANGFDFATGAYAGGTDVGGCLSFGTGAPNNANGANGDIYLRVDGGALTTVYQRRAGAWVGIV